MKTIICDIESVPMSAEILQAKMPESLRKPEMPENIANPEPPNFNDGCPAYASIKDDDLRGQKRSAWVEAKRQKWEAMTQDARQKWELGIIEGRTKFVQDAALDARLGHAKLIGMKDVENNISTVFVWENDPAQIKRINAWLASLSTIQYGDDKPMPVVNNLGRIDVRIYASEDEKLRAFFAVFKHKMEGDAFEVYRTQGQCVTYYGNTFDFPFLYRRAWMLGVPQVPLYRRGRYWDDRMVDLRDCWTMGDRNESSGGLDNMSAALGYDRAKLHDGANFHRFYQEDPSEGLVYLLNDLSCTEYSARKMGIVR